MARRKRAIETIDRDPRVLDVEHTMGVILASSHPLDPMARPRAWLHGLVTGLMLARRDAQSAVDLLDALGRDETLGRSTLSAQESDDFIADLLRREIRRDDA